MQPSTHPITNIHTPSRFAEYVADLDPAYAELTFSNDTGLPTMVSGGSVS